MKVCLYQVGRNLNRAMRTCEAFGVLSLDLFKCDGQMKGSLFAAKDQVKINVIEDWPLPVGLLALETQSRAFILPLTGVDWSSVQTILIGGETSGLPPQVSAQQKAYIPTVGKISGLTVEAALAIALWEWRRNQ